jgi:predicted adenine nucleotide alpha hydrolase (AANH) superfamily ATPase
VNLAEVKMKTVRVLDSNGRRLSPCSPERATALVAQGKARVVSEDPLTVQLPYAVELPPEPEPEGVRAVGEGRRILLHVCCGPCSTYSIDRLREEGFEVTGFWYNPNIHPFVEHEKRLAAMEEYAATVGLPLLREESYEMREFLRTVVGHEAHGERCGLCYAMRLTRTAQEAARRGFDAFTTTLLISPHQDQERIHEAGVIAASEHGVEFHFENLRKGWSERGRLTREHDLYRQQYCGCLYSEWERYSGEQITSRRAGGDHE